MADTLGVSKAREFLAHEPDSTTFEAAYNKGIVAMDAFSVAMGRTPLASKEFLEGKFQSICVNTSKS